MQTWEYFSQLMHAEITKENRAYLEGRFGSVAKFSPRTLIPELNELGKQGWELVHMEPVAGSGSNSDIWWIGGHVPSYSHTYFCVFKRPVG